MPIDYKNYHPDWKFISRQTIKDAGNRCEMCYAPNGAIICWTPEGVHPWRFADACFSDDPDYKTTKIVLTVHHIDGDKENNKRQNLLALCQRHHLRLDLQKHMRNRARSQAAKAGGDCDMFLTIKRGKHD